MESNSYTVEIHVEGLGKQAAEFLFQEIMKLAGYSGGVATGGVYPTPTEAEQIEILKKQAEIIGGDTE